MVAAFTGIFLCQLLGEIATRAFTLPVPGPVLGMGLLFAFLAVRGGKTPAPLAAAADGLLGNLSLLFVPAAVGLMRYFDLIAANAVTVTVAVAASTILAMAATAASFRLLSPSHIPNPETPPESDAG